MGVRIFIPNLNHLLVLAYPENLSQIQLGLFLADCFPNRGLWMAEGIEIRHEHLSSTCYIPAKTIWFRSTVCAYKITDQSNSLLPFWGLLLSSSVTTLLMNLSASYQDWVHEMCVLTRCPNSYLRLNVSHVPLSQARKGPSWWSRDSLLWWSAWCLVVRKCGM